jgi:sugar/nucleoside kinase (ribokinase family)
MTRDDIIRLAREAGVPMEYSFNNRATVWDLHPSLERFAALVAEAEREQCALVAESYEPTCESCPSGVANAIRARGKT